MFLTGGRRVVERESESEGVQYRTRDGRFVRGFGSHHKPRRRLGSSVRSRIASYSYRAGREWNSLERWSFLCGLVFQPLISSVSDGKENVLSTVSGLIAMDDSVTQSTRFCKQANAWKFEVLPCSIMQCETSLRIVTVLPVPWLYDTNSFGYLYE
jgi:hypothetical protein